MKHSSLFKAVRVFARHLNLYVRHSSYSLNNRHKSSTSTSSASSPSCTSTASSSLSLPPLTACCCSFEVLFNAPAVFAAAAVTAPSPVDPACASWAATLVSIGVPSRAAAGPPWGPSSEQPGGNLKKGRRPRCQSRSTILAAVLVSGSAPRVNLPAHSGQLLIQPFYTEFHSHQERRLLCWKLWVGEHTGNLQF